MKENELIEKICSLVIASRVCPNMLPLEWMSRLLYMHRRKWLYCTLKGDHLIAVAGAFRIRQWDDKYLDFANMPEAEEGDILYVPFIASEGNVHVAPLRLLRFCLRKNPNIKELIYYRKNSTAHKRHYRFLRHGNSGIEMPQQVVAA